MQTNKKIIKQKQKQTNNQIKKTDEINRARKHTSKHKQAFNSQVHKYTPHVAKTFVS